MLRVKFPTKHHFTVSIFGCQYHAESPSPARLGLLRDFETLVRDGAVHVEEYEQNDLPSKIWMSYWASPQTFKAWWDSAAVARFWAALPDDAGFWRETVSLPATRAMYETGSVARLSGFGHVGEPVPLTEKVGYWGAYRDRLTPETPGDKFPSPLVSHPVPRPLTREVRAGRYQVKRFPDNICYVVEGQDYSKMGDDERDYWNQHFDGLAKQWITNVVRGGPEQGLVSARACHGFTSGKIPGSTKGANGHVTNGHATNGDGEGDGSSPSNQTTIPQQSTNSPSIFPGLDYVRQTQILFWVDMSAMERMGRHDKVHVKLRRDFMKAYSPGGDMENGELVLWVDLGILKANEIDAEYVGCYDGTGFLAYDDHDSFSCERVDQSSLPSFFDKPVESHPRIW
ncbi:hypothetical protein F5Y15DRAFT_381818 [Xylariaceae sp. FL0016]|nr:hypothetical protein F5Y15DRAFT_381818 [Xylariaceae sp. FL0016]